MKNYDKIIEKKGLSNMVDTKYFKEYRLRLGFNNQQNVKKFFGAKDITPTVDFNYIALLNNRLVEILKKVNLAKYVKEK